MHAYIDGHLEIYSEFIGHFNYLRHHPLQSLLYFCNKCNVEQKLLTFSKTPEVNVSPTLLPLASKTHFYQNRIWDIKIIQTKHELVCTYAYACTYAHVRGRLGGISADINETFYIN